MDEESQIAREKIEKKQKRGKAACASVVGLFVVMAILLVGLNVAKVFQKESGVRELKKLKKLEQLIGNESRLRIRKAERGIRDQLPVDLNELDQRIINEARNDPEVVKISSEMERQKQAVLNSLTDILFDKKQEMRGNSIPNTESVTWSSAVPLQKEKYGKNASVKRDAILLNVHEKSYDIPKPQEVSHERKNGPESLDKENGSSSKKDFVATQQEESGNKAVQNVDGIQNHNAGIRFEENLSVDDRQQLESIKQMIMESMKRPQIKKAVDAMYLLAKERQSERRIKEAEQH